ncbi:hypothetical protein Y032_0253g256 [Ancylostoma ceylanicum]|uniref:Uncharacterized protein n=1 Tax=Ancylostoma ceylanicum TaxID=53326 RepID=A0A016SCK4_9BILA|nr:hypothetical protein Y032_0253g256 [Ancylostoma ceylanicum]
MYPVIAVVPLFFASGLARIIEERAPKVDPLTLDNTISEIVETSMDQMRLRLRQAIYTLALKKNPRFSHPDSGILGKYEEWLLDQFIAQITGAFANGSTPISREREDATTAPRVAPPLHELTPPTDMGPDSHRMTIALETFTTEPLNYQHRKLITADDLRMMDSPAHSSENPMQSHRRGAKIPQGTSVYGEAQRSIARAIARPRLWPARDTGTGENGAGEQWLLPLQKTTSLLFRLPLWQLLLATLSFASFIIVISTLIICMRERRRKIAFPKRTSLPFTLSGVHSIPDSTNTPESFLQRLGQLQRTETVVRERDDTEIWLHPSASRTSRTAFPEV